MNFSLLAELWHSLSPKQSQGLNTRFECSFTSSPLVSSVVFISDYGGQAFRNIEGNSSRCFNFTLQTSVVYFRYNDFDSQQLSVNTRSNFFTLVSSVFQDDWRHTVQQSDHVTFFTKPLQVHSKRVEKMHNYTRNEWRRCITTLETSEEDA